MLLRPSNGKYLIKRHLVYVYKYYLQTKFAGRFLVHKIYLRNDRWQIFIFIFSYIHTWVSNLSQNINNPSVFWNSGFVISRANPQLKTRTNLQLPHTHIPCSLALNSPECILIVCQKSFRNYKNIRRKNIYSLINLIYFCIYLMFTL